MPNFISLCILRDASHRNTPTRRTEWGRSLPPDCFNSRRSIMPEVFLNMNVLQGGVVSTSPNPQTGGPPLVRCPRLLIQFIRRYPPYRRPFLYAQPEDATCRGCRDPLHGSENSGISKFCFNLYAKCGTMDEIHTVNDTKCDIPLSEIFRILLQDRRYIKMGLQEVRLGGGVPGLD